jgi:hypothetical protein
MCWTSWLYRLASRFRRGKQRHQRCPREALWSQPAVRKLEPRRVLNASVQSLIDPALATQGIALVASTDNNTTPQFDWTNLQQAGQTAETTNPDDLSLPLNEPDVASSSVALDDADNVAPAGLVIEPDVTVDEHQLATLNLDFEDPNLDFDDPDTQDTHTASIDWGDGSATENLTLPIGNRNLTLTHQYLDDNPTDTPQGVYTIYATATSDTPSLIPSPAVTAPLASPVEDAPVVVTATGTPTTDLPGFTTWTLRATTDAGGIQGIDATFTGPMNQVNPAGNASIFEDANLFFGFVGASVDQDSQFHWPSGDVVVARSGESTSGLDRLSPGQLVGTLRLPSPRS